MLYKHRKEFYQIFQFCHFLEDIYLSSDQKSLDENSQFELYKSYDRIRNESRNYKFSYDCDMQQSSHEAKYKRSTTLKRDRNIEYIYFLSR